MRNKDLPRTKGRAESNDYKAPVRQRPEKGKGKDKKKGKKKMRKRAAKKCPKKHNKKGCLKLKGLCKWRKKACVPSKKYSKK